MPSPIGGVAPPAPPGPKRLFDWAETIVRGEIGEGYPERLGVLGFGVVAATAVPRLCILACSQPANVGDMQNEA
jgi:hypothetical protein